MGRERIKLSTIFFLFRFLLAWIVCEKNCFHSIFCRQSAICFVFLCVRFLYLFYKLLEGGGGIARGCGLAGLPAGIFE
jgi:hypothetical protein